MFNWESGSWHSLDNNSGERRRITVAADWYPCGTHFKHMLASPAGIYGDLRPLLQCSDINIINVECTLGMLGEPIPKGGPNLRSDDRVINSLLAAPFHVVTLANNHTADFGPAGLADTIDKLEQAGLRTVGAGRNGEEAARPLLLNVGGLQLAIVNCAEGEECRSINGGPGVNGLEIAAVEEQIRLLRTAGYMVLTIFHGGREYAPVPPPYVVDYLRRLAAAGSVAVVAHHPHVPQGIEIVDGVPIAYSLGNFIFEPDKDAIFNHCGYLLHLDFAGGALQGIEVTPYQITLDGVCSMPGDMRRAFMQQMGQVSSLFADIANIKTVWDAVTDEFGLDYFCQTLISEAQAILECRNTVKNAATLKNRFFTQAHRDLYINAMYRVAHQEFDTSPLWARELVRLWASGKMLPMTE